MLSLVEHEKKYNLEASSLPHQDNSFVWFHGKKIWEPQHGRVLSKPMLFVLFVLLLYVPSQQLWSLRDGQFT